MATTDSSKLEQAAVIIAVAVSDEAASLESAIPCLLMSWMSWMITAEYVQVGHLGDVNSLWPSQLYGIETSYHRSGSKVILDCCCFEARTYL